MNVLGKDIAVEEKYYLGNRALPTPDSSYEFTPDMVQSMIRCTQDIKYFAENYFTIIAEGKRCTIPLRPYQRVFLDTMMNEDRVILLTSRQIGKCFCDSTKVKIKLLGIPISLKVKYLWRLLKLINYFKKK